MPVLDTVRQELTQLLTANASATARALHAFTWGTRGQFFWDGNKRTSLVLANKILLEAGARMLTITASHMEQFNTLLLDYYNSGEKEAIQDFLYHNAIQGIQ